MSQYTRRAPWPAVMALAALTVTLGACAGEKKGDDALAQDTTLARDLARVGGDTAVQPQLQDVPAAEPTPEPAPAANPPAPTPRSTCSTTISGNYLFLGHRGQGRRPCCLIFAVIC